MLENALRLWKDRRKYKGTTMQGRLILFFSLIVCSSILLFTLLLMAFGITGSGRQTVHRYLESELSYISSAVETDFGNLSATGIRLAQALSEAGEDFFSEYGMAGSELAARPDAVKGLMDRQLPLLLSAAENNACGGAFIILDASVSAEGQGKRAGIFLKKTQPVSSASLEAETYCLRGPASLAREHEVQLLAQWRMEYEESEIAFFQSVMDTAREHPDLPLSRLFYWTDRVCLSGHSENGMLLCIPLRGEDGSVWGVCGIEVSDRMFKQLYSPGDSEYQGVFAILAPRDEECLFADRGLVAGNTYLTGIQMKMNETLAFTGVEKGFPSFSGTAETYGGLTEDIRLYSEGSPYTGERWAVLALMPKELLHRAVMGSAAYLFFIVAGLMVFSLAASVVVSKRYLQPIKQGLSSIREKEYETGTAEVGIVEIDRLFEDLSRDMREHRDEFNRLAREKQSAEEQYKKVQTQIERLTDKRKQEIDPDDYALFLEKLKTLTAAERRVFELYLEGKTPKEVMESTDIKENTLKYHNRNIFGKLGVSSRKQLLQFATIMQREKEKGE